MAREIARGGMVTGQIDTCITNTLNVDLPFLNREFSKREQQEQLLLNKFLLLLSSRSVQSFSMLTNRVNQAMFCGLIRSKITKANEGKTEFVIGKI